ncbi:MAG: molybdenum cofactor guanylyltransferase [Euryarchaeota archaeon]|nr:molybdenum cofactor guanylyltransferase [Euryarchaeota archaeon]
MHNRDTALGCTAIVIAGGQSRRMGRDKRFLSLGGESFLERVLKVASSVAGEVILSLAHESQVSGVEPGSFRIVLDERPGMGPVHGLISAAREASFPLLAVMPVDSPLLDPGLYRLLLDELGDHEAAVPVVGGFAEPLHGVYRREAVLRAGAEKPGSMNHLLKMLNVNFVPEEKIRSAGVSMLSFVNVNTPEDYERLRERECR